MFERGAGLPVLRVKAGNRVGNGFSTIMVSHKNRDFKTIRQDARKQKSPGSTGERGLLGGLLTRLETVETLSLAEQGGFEPPEGLTPRTLSRRMT